MDQAEVYDERAPLPALTGRVRTVWIQRAGPGPYVQRNLPTGGVELQCPIGSPPQLVGPLTAASVQVLPPGTTVVGVRFWPGAAWSLLGFPVGELADLTVRLDEVCRGLATRLGERLAVAPGPDAALELLQRFLASHQQRCVLADPLVSKAVRRLMPWRPVEVGALTRQLALSTSQMRRRFLVTVGLPPKTVQRTLRFQGYLALAQAAATPGGPAPGGRLADLAAEAGYADHAHLSRECLRLTGLTPRELLGGRADQCGCGHDHAASYRPFLAERVRSLQRR